MPCLIVVWILNKLRDGDASTHQDLLHPGEGNLKGKNQEDGSGERDDEAPDEIHHNTQKADLWVNTWHEEKLNGQTHIIWKCEDGEDKHGENFHMYEVAAIGETGEGGKCRPGEKIIHRTSIALT